MREFINLLNEMSTVALSKLKTDIKTQVDKTSDEELLDKIYTVLNKTNLVDRISGTLSRETDTSGYVADLTKLIIDTPGTYQEKYNFIQGFPTGYVDVKKMLSGERVTFKDLLTGGPFVHRVFDSLKQVTFGTAKGPGEFALAVLSPHIRITGKGDLNIGKEVVEVKANVGASGGRLGTPGSLNFENVANIIAKDLKIPVASIETQNIGLANLYELSSKTTPAVRKKLGTDVFGYIFGNKVDISGLVNALTSGDVAKLKQEYTKTNYYHYQKETGFKGIMLINFQKQELKYYTDPVTMSEEIYEPGVYIVSKDKAFSARQILSQVTLRPFKEPPLIMPDLPQQATGKKPASEKAVTQLFTNYATEWAKRNGISTKPEVINYIVSVIMLAKQKGVQNKSIESKLKREILNNPKFSASANPQVKESIVLSPLRQRR
jgi:hypothetical protein